MKKQHKTDNNCTAKEYVALKSKELLSRQIESSRVIYQKAGIGIATVALFFPILVSMYEKLFFLSKCIIFVIILVMILGVVLLMHTLIAKPLNQGYGTEHFVALRLMDIEKVYDEEITYNKYSIDENQIKIEKQTSFYNQGIVVIIVSIIVSMITLLIDISLKNNYQLSRDIFNLIISTISKG